MPIVSLALKSLLNRRITALITVLSIAVSVLLLLGVDRLSKGTRQSFQSTISGVDLIVGARGSATQLLLYSVFHIGDATKDLSSAAFEDVKAMPGAAWAVPLSLGDSHKGFRVVGTSTDYFAHFKYGPKRALAFAAGQEFSDLFEAVVGAEVADTLGYKVGEEIVIAHGSGPSAVHQHKDKPFRVAGILARTGTPVDRGVYVPIDAITAIHADWQSGAPPRPGTGLSEEAVRAMKLPPPRVTAILVGLSSKLALFSLQRKINEYDAEPLTAILPGVVITDIWRLIGTAQSALQLISAFVIAAGLLGMVGILLTALNERRREIAILRSLGASPRAVLGLFVLEAVFFALAGAVLGYLALAGLTLGFGDLIAARFGLFLPSAVPTLADLEIVGVVVAAAAALGLLPAGIAYRNALVDGLAMRI